MFSKIQLNSISRSKDRTDQLSGVSSRKLIFKKFTSQLLFHKHSRTSKAQVVFLSCGAHKPEQAQTDPLVIVDSEPSRAWFRTHEHRCVRPTLYLLHNSKLHLSRFILVELKYRLKIALTIFAMQKLKTHSKLKRKHFEGVGRICFQLPEMLIINLANNIHHISY